MRFTLPDFFSNDIGIDLGTANTLVYVRGRGIVINEPSVVAVNTKTGKVVAVGAEAKVMLGREPPDLKAHRPLRDGVIADFEYTEAMIRYFIRKVLKNSFFIRPRVVACIPSGVTDVEMRAVRDSAERAGAKEVMLISEPMAAAIGCSLPVEEPVGSMIIDIGGGTSEIAVISLGGIVTAKSVRIGGDEMDEAIINHMKNDCNLQIGFNMAEQIKWKLGSAYPVFDRELEMTVKGLDLIDRIPRSVVVDSLAIRRVLSQPLDGVIMAVRQTLELTPAELAADIIDRGIIISGGGSRLPGLDRQITKETKLPVRLDDEPMTSVVRGAGKIIENFAAFETMLSVLKD
ncbi:MAG: rod shape-determining protein [Gemmatimonadetes bacterium]|nr:rod shape-determining protein [Gemmatimonadota bacterium]MDE2825302.1 rod shape-determining protein [Gemmatimonadota bacterium]MDE2846990.1 rod shape-determining protein [Gemmatimonadota bacterium]MXX04668.1 rod shape-determining protein [Gemmatimonadota bacterium]MXY48648.1 rod shape-determining protein [Gemmatimonadota bacterium]